MTLLDIISCIHMGKALISIFSVISVLSILNVFVRSLSTCLKCFVVNIDIHFSKYLYLSITTTPLPLSCFRITMFLFFDNSQVFSQVFLNLVLILLIPLSGISEISLNKFWKKSSNSVAIVLLLVFVGI